MKHYKILFPLLASAMLVGGTQLTKVGAKVEERDASVIVTLTTEVKEYNQGILKAEQNYVLSTIRNEVTPNIRVTSQYMTGFNGFSLKIPSAYVNQLRELPYVKTVSYENQFAAPTARRSAEQINNYIMGTKTSPSSETVKKPAGTKEGSGTLIAILDSAFYIYEEAGGTKVQHNVYSELTNPEDVVRTQESIRAKIDAASNFHGKPDATHSTYWNNKVVFYYDYGGDDSKGTPDYVVWNADQDHGTHVSSIAAGNAGDEYEGIAPRAQLALMKVFRTTGSGNSATSGAGEAAILNAMEDCITIGADVISLSLGSGLNDIDATKGSGIYETIEKCQELGIFVNFAAGNDGRDSWSNTTYQNWDRNVAEPGFLGGYPTFEANMSVASSQADRQYYNTALIVGGHNISYEDEVVNYKSTSGDVVFSPERRLEDITNGGTKLEFDYVKVPGIGAEGWYIDNDGSYAPVEEGARNAFQLKDYSETNVDLTGKIAVIDRGSTTFANKVSLAYQHGAVAAIIINNEQLQTEFNMRMDFGKDSSGKQYTPEIPVAFALYRDRDTFISNSGTKAKFIIKEEIENPDKGTISDYTSDGPTFDLRIKPEITSPGENIRGAVITGTNHYDSMSGTSMATPNFSGAMALMISEGIARNEINARFMSTATPLFDKAFDPVTGEKTHTSVRRQGAGLFNLSAALSTEVFLSSKLDDQGNPINRAKIELGNNEDIKKGDVKLSFAAVNNKANAVNYKATTYVYSPRLQAYDIERFTGYPELEGHKFQTSSLNLLGTATQNVELVPGKSTITLDTYSLTEEAKTALQEFTQGTFIEGYVKLEAEGETTLHIPFLGYYGDYESAMAVEPFDFEKEEGKFYQSYLLNELAKINLSYQSNGMIPAGEEEVEVQASFGSNWSVGYFSSNPNLDDVWKNKLKWEDIQDTAGHKIRPVGMNPYTGEIDASTIYVGNNAQGNMMLIQQIVYRTCKSGKILIKDKNGEVIQEAVIKDCIYNTPDLMKSHVLSALWDDYMAHRAYAFVPLMTKNVAGKKSTIIPDGEYTVEFSYELLAGGTYTKKYNMVMDSTAPSITSSSKVVEGGTEYLRIRYKDINLSYVTANGGEKLPVQKDAQGYYVDVPTTEYKGASKTLILGAVDGAYNISNSILHAEDFNGLIVSHANFDETFDFTSSIVDETETNSKLLKVTITYKNGSTYSVRVSTPYTYIMKLPEGYDPTKVEIYACNATGADSAKLDFVNNGDGTVTFESTLKNFRLYKEGRGNGQKDPEPGPINKGCKSSMLNASICLPMLAAVVLIFIRRKEEK